MTGKIDQLKAGQLEHYLRNITPEATVRLVRGIELARQQGLDDPSYEVILSHAREVMRKSGVHAERQASVFREFSMPFEDLLVNCGASDKQRGRISRTSIKPVWNWLNDHLLPERLHRLATELEQSLYREDRKAVKKLSAELYQITSAALKKAFAKIEGQEKERGRLEVQLGGHKVLEDAREMAVAIALIQVTEKLKKCLPDNIIEFDGKCLKTTLDHYKVFLKQAPDHPEIAIATILRRLKRKGQILRIAKKITGKEEDGIIARTPHGIAGEILLFDMQNRAEEIAKCIVHHEPAEEVLYSLKRFYELANGFTVEIRLNMKGDWGRKLILVRKTISDLLSREITSVPRLIKKALWGQQVMVSKKETASSSASSGPDRESLAEAERALKILAGGRFYSEQLSLNDKFYRLTSDINQFMDAIVEKIIMNIEDDEDDAQSSSMEYLKAAVKLMRIVRGDEVADLLWRRGQVASQAKSQNSIAS